jgi:hypothetical protein
MAPFGYDIAIAEIKRIQNGMVDVRENDEDDAKKVAIMILEAKEKNESSYKKAFYKKSRLFHPDKFLPSCSNICSKIFVLINEAKDYLCDETQQKHRTPEGTYKTDFERLIKGYSKRTLMWETPEEREVRVSLELGENNNEMKRKTESLKRHQESKRKTESLKRHQEAKRKTESLKRHQEAKRKTESLKRHQAAKEKESMEKKRASEKEANIKTSVVDSLDKDDLVRRQNIESLERKRIVAERIKADSLERKRRIESLERKTIVAERMKADSLQKKQKFESLDKKAIVAEKVLQDVERKKYLNSGPMDIVSPTTSIKTVRKNVKKLNKKQTQKNSTRLKRIEQVMIKRGIIM